MRLFPTLPRQSAIAHGVERAVLPGANRLVRESGGNSQHRPTWSGSSCRDRELSGNAAVSQPLSETLTAGLQTNRSELPLKAELHLACVQCFDEATVRIQAVIGAYENRIGVIG